MPIDSQQTANHAFRARNRARNAGFALYAIMAVAAAAAAVVAVKALQPVATPGATVSPPQFPAQATATKAEISGVDKDQLPFTIKAEKGIQDKSRSEVVHLETVDSTFARPEGKAYAVTSAQAQFNQKTKRLDVSGDVTISDNTKMVARMKSAEVDTDTRSFKSTSPVEVTMENGFVTADHLVTNSNGERLLFKGRVKARYATSR